MISKEDFQIEDPIDLLHFIPIVVFVGLCAPFLFGAYKLGFVLDQMDLLD